MEKKFSSDELPLAQLLDRAASGELQLPDFQRGWVWDDDHIRSLLVSISLSYPIGAVMTLVAGNPDVNFKARLLEGVTLASHTPAPEMLLLDGQQRLTSLFQALEVPRHRSARGTAAATSCTVTTMRASTPASTRVGGTGRGRHRQRPRGSHRAERLRSDDRAGREHPRAGDSSGDVPPGPCSRRWRNDGLADGVSAIRSGRPTRIDSGSGSDSWTRSSIRSCSTTCRRSILPSRRRRKRSVRYSRRSTRAASR